MTAAYRTEAFSLYVHIPFCSRKCPYCDFTTVAAPSIPEDRYAERLCEDIRSWRTSSEFGGRELYSIYFGGGTPSLFSADSITRILDTARESFSSDGQIEITLEANPGEIDLEKLARLAAAGVSRISFGSQSLQDATLTTLGRRHRGTDVIQAVEWARDAGILNINLDCIFGVPQQSVEDLRRDLEGMTAFPVQHLSAYGLTYETGTPFYQSMMRGSLMRLDDDLVAQMYELLVSTFEANGFTRYEVSNFAKSSFESKHNRAYWTGRDYLGVGIGAHSFAVSSSGTRWVGARRWANTAELSRYLQSESLLQEAWSEQLSLEALTFEFFFVGLRQSEGVSLDEFERRYGAELLGAYLSRFQALQEDGLVSLEQGTIACSPRGILVLDSVLESIAEVAALERLS